MASAQNQAPNADPFDAYFRRADLDRDGRISGTEAVSFFQGSGLPKQVLAQIWALADQRQSGFLGRAEFYNALKLVTVAQSKRELTPEIVKAALYGPAAAKIPAPQINFSAIPASRFNSVAAVPASQSATVTPTSSQNVGFRGPQVSPNVSMNQPHAPSQEILRPPQATSHSATRPIQGYGTQGFPGAGTVAGLAPSNSSISSGWVGGGTGGAQRPSSQPLSSGTSLPTNPSGLGLVTTGSTTSLPTRPHAVSEIQPSGARDSKTTGISGNGFPADSIFGGDVFSATPPVSKPDSSASAFTGSNVTVSSANVPLPSGMQPSVRPRALDSSLVPNNVTLSSASIPAPAGAQPSVRPRAIDSSLVPSNATPSSSNVPVPTGTQISVTPRALDQSSFSMQHVGGWPQQTQSIPNQQVLTQSTSSGVSHGAEKSISKQSQQPWPRMTQTDVQKYTKVFVEVDKDRDGKITGEQARNLFLSWRLPREVLKQVWDLSDQDNDSMLSLREFCIALYLMERYREGRPLPAVLPTSTMFESPSTVQHATNYSNNTAWGHTSGFPQHRGVSGSGVPHGASAAGGKPPKPPVVPKVDEGLETTQQKSRVPVLEKHLVDQLSTEEQNSLNSKFHEATDAEKKVEELEKEILDSRAKIEFCRTKMQELVLYKSRCDNRLNEITERVSADKLEVESLAKKYEDKCKQLGDVASRLTIEEATFRDIQEKKMELYQAIVKMEAGGADSGNLKARADRIQSDLDELVKALNERCKSYGLRTKPTTVTELPFGWQPGIQEGAADWDEDWDKFEDEGFTFVKELTLDVQNVVAPPKERRKVSQTKNTSTVESPRISSSHDVDSKEEKPHGMDENFVENGSAYNNENEDESAKSAPNSPVASSAMGSPKEFHDSHFGMAAGFDASPSDKETQSDHGGAGSVFSGDKIFDEPSWGTFDNNDDVDSVWGFNAVSTTKDSDQDRFRENYSFSSEDFGLNPIRTGSPQAGGLFPKKSTFSFDESVPSTPLYNSVNSPHGSEYNFDSFSRFDSFSMRDNGIFPPKETFARFDSMCSSRDFEHSHGFPSFDDPDPFGSSGPFRTSLESQTPRADPFGSSGPFKTSVESQTPRADAFGSSEPFKTSLESRTPRGDPFGSGPFRTSFDSQTPRADTFGYSGPFKTSLETRRKGPDNWSAF